MMSKQYHYVVFFDTATGEWSIDHEVSINYDEGSVWDTKKQEWSYFNNDEDVLMDDKLLNDLTKKLGMHEMRSV
jgi:hypothetical protein